MVGRRIGIRHDVYAETVDAVLTTGRSLFKRSNGTGATGTGRLRKRSLHPADKHRGIKHRRPGSRCLQ